MAKTLAERVAATKATETQTLIADAETASTPGEALAVTSVPNQALAEASVDLSRDLTSDDFRLPQLKLGQQMSKAVANELVKAGSYYLSLGNVDLGTSVQVVVATMYKSRSFFQEGSMLCRSYDMVQGIGTPGIACGSCDLKDWQGDQSKRIPPVCKESYNYGVVIIPKDEDIPPTTGIMRLSGTSTPAAKDLNGLVMQRSTEMAPHPVTGIPTPIPAWSKHRFILSTERRSMRQGVGTYYVVSISLGPKVDPDSDEAKRALILAQTLSPQRIAVSLEATDTDEA